MMDCRTFALLLDKPETEWTRDERRAAETHAASCADCAMLLTMRREMRAMDEDAQLPENFTASWKYAIHAEAEKKMNKKTSAFPWRRVLTGVAAAAVLAIGTTASYLNDWGREGVQSARQETAYQAEATEYDAEYEYAEEPEYYEDYAVPMESDMGMAGEAAPMAKTAVRAAGNGTVAAAKAESGEKRTAKIIRSADISLQTQRYESDYEAIRNLVTRCGGRVENLNAYGDGSASSLRRVSFTLRIPTDRLDDFLEEAKAVSTVTAFSENSDDVSDSYYDTRARLDTQKAKMARLTELMAKAEDVSDLIELENAISDAQYWIDYYTGQLGDFDSRIDESYVYVTLREITSADAAADAELSLGERIANAVRASLHAAGEAARAMVVFLVAALPWAAALGAVILIAALIVRGGKRRKIKEKPENGD